MDEESVKNTFIGKIVRQREKLFENTVQYIPAWISPNAISFMRMLLIIPIYLLYKQETYGWMIVLFVFSLVTDAIDGAHARYYNKVTNLGKLLDPATDKVLLLGVLLMVAPDRLSAAVIITILALEAILVLFAVVFAPLAARFFQTKRKLGANAGGKIKMGLEGLSLTILLIGLNNQTVIYMAEALMWLAAVFALLSIILHLTTKEQSMNN